MADAFTTNFNWTLPEVTASNDTWGTKLNANWSDLDGRFNATPALLHEYGGLEADVSAYSGLLKITGGTTSAVTITTAGEDLLDDADAAAQRATLGLVIDTHVQGYDANLASWEAITRAAGFDTFVATPSSANLATLLSDETGSGAAVFNTSPTITTPTISGDLTAEHIVWEQGINSQVGTTYTLVIGDHNKIVEMNNAAANTLTVPPNSSVAFPVGTRIDVIQMGAGTTTIEAGVGVTIRSADSALDISGQYAGATLYKRATDEWVLIGSLA